MARAEIRNATSKLLSREWATLTQYRFDLKRRDGVWEPQVRECYDRGNAAVILPYDPKRKTVLLVRQFRLPVHLQGDDSLLIEACAGLLEGDDPETCIRKEAGEELGYKLSTVKHLYDIYMSPGSVTEKLSFFSCHYSPSDRVSSGGGNAHEGEDIEVIEMTLNAAWSKVKNGEIIDAKTVLLIQHALIEGFG
jgi:nudix-type nucleoside diphosphatase (YffH/AdpP family)